MLFDTHAHLTDERYDSDRESLISLLYEQGVSTVLNVGSDLNNSMAGILLAEQYDFIYASVGVHPHHAKDFDDNGFEKLKEILKMPKVVALGEIGLDYYYDFAPKEVQKAVFVRQLALAREEGIPVIIHSRDAWQDTMDILKEYPGPGVMHCFSGAAENVKEVLDVGLFLSFNGIITFSNAKKPIEALRATPIEKLILETDSPYLTPVPYRGKRNSPEYVKNVAECAANILGMDYQELVDITTQNGKKLFNIE